jgi:hypothetical protein
MDETTAQEAPAVIRRPVVQHTIGGSVYVKPQDIAWEPTQFDGISIKVLYEDKATGEMTCLLKWEPGAALPMHKHPAIEQTWSSKGHSTITTASAELASSSGGGSARSTRHTRMRVQLSSRSIGSRMSSNTVPDTHATKCKAPTE